MSNYPEKTPTYSFVLPARNAGRYIRECIESILSQSYAEFDLLILENKSEDDTLSIIESFQDPRIKVFPSERPLSIEENWTRVSNVAKNEFMTITGHDDVFDPDYLQRMDGLIRRYPEASLYQSHFRYIDGNGEETGKCTPMDEVQLPEIAVSNFISGKTDVIGTGFLMRSEDFEAAGGMPTYPNLLFADMEIWIELSRKSYLAVEPEELFSYRRHSASTTSGTPDVRLLAAFERIVNYLAKLQEKNPALAEPIRTQGKDLLLQYCVGLTHSILRTPRKERVTPNVAEVQETFRRFAVQLGVPSFEPLSHPKLRIGKMIDGNPLLQWLFLWFSPVKLHSQKKSKRSREIAKKVLKENPRI